MVGGSWSDPSEPIPTTLNWLSKKIWSSICQVSKNLAGFESLIEDFKKYSVEFTHIYNSIDPYS